jgi:crotonobetainyl-CoA:carnitine CoA-transferase CaiB-like acyl-CoA transferase
MHKPLSGLRILAIEQYGAGPYGTQLLASLGADVIKIENPATGGDSARSAGPHFLGDHDSQYFQTFNRGKRSLALDLKDKGDRRIFERLVETADAVANNLRGDHPASLGVDYKNLAPIKATIVCAHLSAYGRGNSREAWPGYDYLAQAEAGFMALTGEPDGPPARFGLSVVDLMTGTLMATGLLSAIVGARQTGKGCDIDTSLMDTALHQLSYPGTWYLNEGRQIDRLQRSAHPAATPSQLFKTRDGWIFIMCQLPKFWVEFCQQVGRTDLLSRPEFADMAARRKHRDQLQEELDAFLSLQPTSVWMERLGGKIPVAPVNTLAEALEAEHAQGMIETVDHPEKPDGLRLMREPIAINGERPSAGRAPRLGEHTQDILDELLSEERQDKAAE